MPLGWGGGASGAAFGEILKANGTPLPGYIAIELDRMPTAPDAVKILYAPDSGDTVIATSRRGFCKSSAMSCGHGKAKGGGWDPARLAPGDSAIRICAADWVENGFVRPRHRPRASGFRRRAEGMGRPTMRRAAHRDIVIGLARQPSGQRLRRRIRVPRRRAAAWRWCRW